MSIVTHQFTHIETLERARRWLIQAGIDPSRIEAHTHGIPRIAVTVEGGEAHEVHRIIDAAESADPDGNASIWDLARHEHAAPLTDPKAGTGAAPHATRSESFVVSWRPQDADLEVTQTHTDANLRKEYTEGKE
jgi:hypothetical protein